MAFSVVVFFVFFDRGLFTDLNQFFKNAISTSPKSEKIPLVLKILTKRVVAN